MIFGPDGDVPIEREDLEGGWQARYDHREGTIYIDTSVPDCGIEEIINQIQHKLIGNDHLAPNCYPYVPGRHLKLCDPLEDTSPDENDDRGVG